MRDRLPELLGGQAAGELARVREHVATCEACRAELALLRSVRDAVRAPTVDVARISAAIPSYRAVPAWRRLAQAPAFRMAAAILLMVGVGTLVVSDASDRGAPDTAMIVPVPPVSAGELPVGTPLGELSESDLRELLSELGDLQAVTPTDADVVVLPALDRSGA